MVVCLPNNQMTIRSLSAVCQACAFRLCIVSCDCKQIVKTKRILGSIASRTARATTRTSLLRAPLRLTQSQVPSEYCILNLSDPLHGCPGWACNTSGSAITPNTGTGRKELLPTRTRATAKHAKHETPTAASATYALERETHSNTKCARHAFKRAARDAGCECGHASWRVGGRIG